MTTLGYFPGCSLTGSAAEYDKSVRAIAGRLDVELREVPEWVCCGASSAHALDHHAALCLAADTLAKASRAGLDHVLAPCAMCYQRLATAVHEMTERPTLGRELAAALGNPTVAAAFRQSSGGGTPPPLAGVRPLSLLNWLGELPADAIKAQVTKPLAGLKVACYYGCLLLRPPKITGSTEVESPRSMERLLTLLGAQGVRWPMATECCGASFALSRKEVVLRQGHQIYRLARKAGADVICLACPMCHNNLDMRQAEFAAGEDELPVVYLSQLIGLAFGIPADDLGLDKHFVAVEPTMARVRQLSVVSGQ